MSMATSVFSVWKPAITFLGVHRLDRQTSGIVVLAKDEKTAKDFSSDMVSHKIQKTYLARV